MKLLSYWIICCCCWLWCSLDVHTLCLCWRLIAFTIFPSS